MTTDLLRGLAQQWHDEAEFFRSYGDEGRARACEKHAEELEERIREWRMELLTIEEAAAESGYSEDHLYDLVSKGTIPNAGRKGAPRIRRCDLPRKPGGGPDPEPRDDGDFADEILRARGTS